MLGFNLLNNKIYIKKFINFLIITLFSFILILGFYISNDFGMAYDVLGYRQQGLIILNHIGNIFFSEITKNVVRDLDIVNVSEYYFAFSGVPLHSTFCFHRKNFFFDFETKKEVYYFKYKLNFFFNFVGCIFFSIIKKKVWK